MATTQARRDRSEAAIFARVWEGNGRGLSVPLARHVLKLGFSEDDQALIRELLERNRAGELSDREREELDNFVKVADLLAILQSKARKFLKGRGTPRDGHG
jgi:hypothetical protein